MSIEFGFELERQVKLVENGIAPAYFSDTLSSRGRTLLRKFLRAGFTKGDLIQNVSVYDLNGLAADRRFLTSDFLRFISDSLEPKTRKLFVRRLLFEPDASESLSNLSKKCNKDESLALAFKDFCGKSLGVNYQQDFWARLFLGSEIIQNEVLFDLFGKSSTRIADFIRAYVRKESEDGLSNLLEPLRQLSKSPNSSIILEGLDESYLLDNTEPSLINILRSWYLPFKSEKGTCEIVNEFLRNGKSWAVRASLFPRVLEASGIPFVTEKFLERKLLGREIRKNPGFAVRNFLGLISPSEKFSLLWNLKRRLGKRGLQRFKMALKRSQDIPREQRWFEGINGEVLKRIKRRENPLHPLNTLRLVRTVGYEVEYPSATGVNRYLQTTNFDSICELLGFKKGHGGLECDEISPGPFYDPLTANLIFGRYVDAGIINLDTYEGMTMHFNVGLKRETGLAKLIRAMYLTGAAYDPDHFPEKYQISIYRNNQGSGDYYETKAFDVMEKKDFEWNMRCVSYLSWALGAYQEKLFPASPGYKWKKELSSLWRRYLSVIQKGANSVRIGSYLKNGINSDPSVQIVHDELGRILPDPLSRYKDPNRYKSKELGPVKLGKKVAAKLGLTRTTWPNIVAFSREVTEDVVQKIERVVDSVEKEAVYDIQRIDLASGKRRQKLIREFLQKYNVDRGKKLKKKAQLASYEKVRAIFEN